MKHIVKGFLDFDRKYLASNAHQGWYFICFEIYNEIYDYIDLFLWSFGINVYVVDLAHWISKFDPHSAEVLDLQISND